jgi:hypothetical protein
MPVGRSSSAFAADITSPAWLSFGRYATTNAFRNHNNMKRILFLLVGLASVLIQPASAAVLESWENNLDGWYMQNASYTFASSFSSSLGVTDGSYSLALTATAPQTPGFLFIYLSPYQSSYTTALATSSALTLDVYAPPNSFGGYLLFNIFIYNPDTGFTALSNESFFNTTLGSETTLTYSIPSATAAILAASSNGSEIGIQAVGGYSADNETVYLDNLQTVPAPEPGTLELVGLGAVGLLTMWLRLTMWPLKKQDA